MPVRREKGRYFVVGERRHWRDMLSKAEIAFVERVLKGNGKDLPYDESQKWHELHEHVDTEGWSGWRLVNSQVKGLSLVAMDSVHETPLEIQWDDYKKKKPGPLEPLLDGFVHEEGWQS